MQEVLPSAPRFSLILGAPALHVDLHCVVEVFQRFEVATKGRGQHIAYLEWPGPDDCVEECFVRRRTLGPTLVTPWPGAVRIQATKELGQLRIGSERDHGELTGQVQHPQLSTFELRRIEPVGQFDDQHQFRLNTENGAAEVMSPDRTNGVVADCSCVRGAIRVFQRAAASCPPSPGLRRECCGQPQMPVRCCWKRQR